MNKFKNLKDQDTEDLGIRGRVGKQPIEYTSDINISDIKKSYNTNSIIISNSNGKNSVDYDSDLFYYTFENGKLFLKCINLSDDTKRRSKRLLNSLLLKQRRMYGTLRQAIYNSIIGLTEGFCKKMFVRGKGYAVEDKANELVFNLGFSHNKALNKKVGLKYVLKSKQHFEISGTNISEVHQTAATAVKLRKKDNYRGYGVHDEDKPFKCKKWKRAR